MKLDVVYLVYAASNKIKISLNFRKNIKDQLFQRILATKPLFEETD